MFKMLSTMTLLGLATLSETYAQSQQPIQAKVPFTFMVHNTTLSAGKYQLTYSNSAHNLWIRGLDENSPAMFVTAIPMAAIRSSDSSGKLVFDCYANSCYLAQVWQGSRRSNRGLELRPSEQQRRLALATRVVSTTIPAK